MTLSQSVSVPTVELGITGPAGGPELRPSCDRLAPAPAGRTQARGSGAMRFSFTYLWVPDVDEAMAFHQKAFGLPVRVPPEAGEWGLLGDPSHPLGFEAHRVAPERARGAFPDDYVRGKPAGFYLVHDVPELSSALARAVDAGCTVLSGPELTPAQNHVAFVVDPYGIVVELLQRPPRRPPASGIEKGLVCAAVAFTAATAVVGGLLLWAETPPPAGSMLAVLMGWCVWLGALGGAWRTRAWRWSALLRGTAAFGAVAAVVLGALLLRHAPL
jgi:lactoylglutathione lyase